MNESSEISQKIPLTLEANKSRIDSSVNRITTKAIGFCWDKATENHEVVFPSGKGKVAVGVETIVPIKFSDVKETFENLLKIYAEQEKIEITEEQIKSATEKNKDEYLHIGMVGKLPDNIKRIRIIDMASEEALPYKERQIKSKISPSNSVTRNLNFQSSEHNIIDKLLVSLQMKSALRSISKRTDTLSDIFVELFSNQGDRDLFAKTLEKSTAEEILIIHGHGGDDNIIGEQRWEFDGPKDETVTPNIDLEQLVEKYDDPKRVAAIIVHTCYEGKEKPPVRRIPVYRFYGESGKKGLSLHPSKTLISRPIT